MSKEAMKLALEALNWSVSCMSFDDYDDMPEAMAELEKAHKAIKALEESLTKQEQGVPEVGFGNIKQEHGEPVAWRHCANEWADATYNALQHLKNVRDGYSAEAAIANMEVCIKHCKDVQVEALKAPQPKQEQCEPDLGGVNVFFPVGITRPTIEEVTRKPENVVIREAFTEVNDKRLEQEQGEPVACVRTHQCKSVSSEYINSLNDLHFKACQKNLNVAYCIEWVRKMAEKLDTIVSHTETWTGKDGYPKHVLTSVEMVPQLRNFLEKGIHDTFISHMKQCLDSTTPPPCQTCEAIARTVMLDQSSHDTTQQRKPLTAEQIKGLVFDAGYIQAEETADFINGIRHGEAAHGIKE